MAEKYSDIKLIRQERQILIWQGPLRPLHKTYQTQIVYRVPFAIELIDLIRDQPKVQIIRPKLKPLLNTKDSPLPHVYPNKSDHSLPFLCLFDPDAREWTPSDLLAETTVPWTAHWLACYEGWRATGVWRGGGRHGTNTT